MEVVREIADVRKKVRLLRARGRVGFVPTMGALHAGHVSLIEASRRDGCRTVASLFVNPTQFGPSEDFSRYPRPLERDLALCEGAGADLVFVPAVETMYPPGAGTLVDVGPVSEPLEGACRPGHYRGVATIVLKLLNLVTPDVAYFGQKDFQQSLVIQRMTKDLDVPVEIRVEPTVREADGLALSSRNVYLSLEARQKALTLSRALRGARALVAAGERDVQVLLQSMQEEFDRYPEVIIDYLAIRDPATLAEIKRIEHRAIALIAARVEGTRLIDNERLG